MKDINLLPEDIKSTSTYSPSKYGSGVSVKAIIGIVFVVLFIAATLAAPKVYIKTLETSLAKVEKELEDPKYDVVKKVKADISSVDALINKKNFIMNDIDSKSYPINEILLTVNSAVPSGCKVSSLSYTGTSLVMSGNADNVLAIAELMSRLQRLDFVQIANDVSVNDSKSFTINLIVGRKG